MSVSDKLHIYPGVSTCFKGQQLQRPTRDVLGIDEDGIVIDMKYVAKFLMYSKCT